MALPVAAISEMLTKSVATRATIATLPAERRRKGVTLSLEDCNGTWTSAPLSAHLSNVWECLKLRHPYVPTAQQLTISSIMTTGVRRSERITDGMPSGWRKLRDSVRSFPTSEPTLLERPCQEQRGSRLAAVRTSVGRSAPANTNDT